MTVSDIIQLFNTYPPCSYANIDSFAYIVGQRRTVLNYCTRTAPECHMEVSQ